MSIETMAGFSSRKAALRGPDSFRVFVSLRRAVMYGLAALAIWGSPVAVTSSAAQQPSPEQLEHVRESCRSDFIAHCSDVQPGGPEALQCLRRNSSQLSAACNGAVSALAPAVEPPQQAGEAQQPPQQAQPAEPQPTAAADQGGAVRKACTIDDYLSHCSWIQPTSPELVLCLRANAPRLSSGCQAAVGAAPDAAAPPPVAAPAQPPPPPAAIAAVPPTPAPPAAAATPMPPIRAPAARQPTAQQASVIRAACRSDFNARCTGVQPGGREALQCLQRNLVRLSRPCQRALAALGGPAPAATAPGQDAPAAATPAAAPEPLRVRPLRPREEIGLLRTCAADTRTLCGGVAPGGGRIVACLVRNASGLGAPCRDALSQLRR